MFFASLIRLIEALIQSERNLRVYKFEIVSTNNNIIPHLFILFFPKAPRSDFVALFLFPHPTVSTFSVRCFCPVLGVLVEIYGACCGNFVGKKVFTMENAENTHAGKASAAASHHCPTPVAANGNDFSSADELIAENRRRNEALVSP